MVALLLDYLILDEDQTYHQTVSLIPVNVFTSKGDCFPLSKPGFIAFSRIESRRIPSCVGAHSAQSTVCI